MPNFFLILKIYFKNFGLDLDGTALAAMNIMI